MNTLKEATPGDLYLENRIKVDTDLLDQELDNLLKENAALQGGAPGMPGTGDSETNIAQNIPNLTELEAKSASQLSEEGKRSEKGWLEKGSDFINFVTSPLSSFGVPPGLL